MNDLDERVDDLYGFEARLLNELVNILEREDEPPREGPKPGRRLVVRLDRRAWYVAAVIAVVALVAQAIAPAGGAAGAHAAAAQALHQVALTASEQPAGATPSAGQYFYTESVQGQTYFYVTGPHAEGFWFARPETERRWIATDGSGRIVSIPNAVTFPTPADEAAWLAAGSPNLSEEGSDSTYGPGALDYVDTSALPTDPNALLTALEAIVNADSGHSDPSLVFKEIGDLLRQTGASPDLRAALYEIASRLPGVELVGEVSDGLGRSGIAVAYVREKGRFEFIFDPATSDLLGESQGLTPDAVSVEEQIRHVVGDKQNVVATVGKPGGIMWSASYYPTTVVDDLGDADLGLPRYTFCLRPEDTEPGTAKCSPAP